MKDSDATLPFSSYSLGEMENFYRQGVCSYPQLVSYIRAWNCSGKHMTRAYWADGAIRQFDPDHPTAGLYARYNEEFACDGFDFSPTPPMTPERLDKIDACRHLLPPPSAEVVGELTEALRRYMKAMTAIYNHNEAARVAVIQHFGPSQQPELL